jgi:hypothetical protein
MVHAKKIIIRSKKADSAFIYHVLEAHEGLTAYATINYQLHDQHRDVELIFAPEQEADVRKLLLDFGEMITIL